MYFEDDLSISRVIDKLSQLDSDCVASIYMIPIVLEDEQREQTCKSI